MTDPMDELKDAVNNENTDLARSAHKTEHGEAEVEQFVNERLLPTLTEIGDSMTGLRPDVSPVNGGAQLLLFRGDKQEFSFEAKAPHDRSSVLLQITYQQRKHQGAEPHYNTVPYRVTGTLRVLADISRDDIVTEFTERYKETE